jgi:hypothetical protein
VKDLGWTRVVETLATLSVPLTREREFQNGGGARN